MFDYSSFDSRAPLLRPFSAFSARRARRDGSWLQVGFELLGEPIPLVPLLWRAQPGMHRGHVGEHVNKGPHVTHVRELVEALIKTRARRLLGVGFTQGADSFVFKHSRDCEQWTACVIGRTPRYLHVTSSVAAAMWLNVQMRTA
jgi:hypothetical protein